MTRGGILQRLRSAGLVLALFALTFKALLPPGYMLSAADDHQVVVSLCGGGEAILDLGGDSGDHMPTGDAASAHCPFAFTSAPVLAEPSVAAPVTVLTSIGASPLARSPPSRVQSSVGPPLPARGPPLHA